MIRARHATRHDPAMPDPVREEDKILMPLPSELWAKAGEEHPDDVQAQTEHYAELMVAYGHIVKVEE